MHIYDQTSVNYKNQELIEQKYSRKNIRKKVLEDIDPNHEVLDKMVTLINNYLDRTDYYESKQTRVNNLSVEPIDIAIEICAAILIYKDMTPIQAIATQVGQQLEYEKLLDGVKTAAELIAVCDTAGLYDIHHSSSHFNKTGTLAIHPKYSLSKDVQHFINQTKYLPPMVCKPVPWFSNRGGGNIQGKDSVILGYLNHHEDTQALDVINILQDIEWQLCDMVDYEEQPNKPLNTVEKINQFKQLKEESLEVYRELIEHGNKFYFVWRYDKRGRMYSMGYHCNLQATEYKKAILEFSKEELIQ